MIKYLMIKNSQTYSNLDESEVYQLKKKDKSLSILKKGEIYQIIDYYKMSEYYTNSVNIPIIKVNDIKITLERDTYTYLNEEECRIYKQDVTITKEFISFPIIEDSNKYNKNGLTLHIGQVVFIEGFVKDDDTFMPYFIVNNTRYQLEKESIISSVMINSLQQRNIIYDY